MGLTRFGQAIQRVELKFGAGVVVVVAGMSTWICASSAFAAARDALARLPPISTGPGDASAYEELRAAITGPIISIDGGADRGSSGARRILATRALASGHLPPHLVPLTKRSTQ